MTTILGADISHYQAANMAQIKAAGRSFIILKATESVALARKRMVKLGATTELKSKRPSVTIDGVRHRLPMRYVDPTMSARRQQAHAAGLIVGLYHFARAGNATAEAAYFLKTVGALQVGEFVVLDWEVPAADPVGWCKAWLDTVYNATGVRPLIYMNQSAATGSNWSAVAKDYGLWLARYDGSTAQPSIPPWSVAMKQYSDKGSVPGVGLCDVDVFYGDVAQLLKYGKGGQPIPNVITPGAPEMRLARTPDGTIWAVTDTRVVPLTDQTLANDLAAIWGPWASVPDMAGVSAFADQLRGLAEDTHLFALQARDAATGANNRSGDILAAVNTQVIPGLGQAAASSIDQAKLDAAVQSWLTDNVDALGARIAAHLKLTSD